MGIPGPTDLIRVAGQGYTALERVIALVPRLVGMVSEVEGLIGRVQSVVSDIEATQQRATAAVDHIEDAQRRANAAIDHIEHTQQRATAAVDRIELIQTRVEAVLDRTDGWWTAPRASSAGRLQLTRRIEPLLDTVPADAGQAGTDAQPDRRNHQPA